MTSPSVPRMCRFAPLPLCCSWSSLIPSDGVPKGDAPPDVPAKSAQSALSQPCAPAKIIWCGPLRWRRAMGRRRGREGGRHATIVRDGSTLAYRSGGCKSPPSSSIHGWTCNRSFFKPSTITSPPTPRVSRWTCGDIGNATSPGHLSDLGLRRHIAFLIDNLSLGRVIAVGTAWRHHRAASWARPIREGAGSSWWIRPAWRPAHLKGGNGPGWAPSRPAIRSRAGSSSRAPLPAHLGSEARG